MRDFFHNEERQVKKTGFYIIKDIFLGNGQSDRVEKFSSDIGYEGALQTIALVNIYNRL